MQLMTTTSAIALQYAVFRNIKMTEKPMVSRREIISSVYQCHLEGYKKYDHLR